MSILLAIESSCDETAAAIISDGKLVVHHLSSQLDHAQYGGVVPELASRLHQQQIVKVVDACMKDADILPEQIQAIAVTQGPGLMGALWVGVSFAKAFAMARNIPLIGVNHLDAHVLSHFLADEKPEFPFLCLTVSGGHTQIIVVKDFHELEVLGDTLDDAAGEAFDKAAKMIGLPYPGGPLIDQLAKTGNSNRFSFPSPCMKDLNYSFSGLKTSLLYFLRDNQKNVGFREENLNDICASFQNAIVSGLLSNLNLAAKQTGINRLALAGGVSANTALRSQFTKMCDNQGYKGFIVPREYCTDNAAMIGIAGWYHWKAGKTSDLSLMPFARMGK